MLEGCAIHPALIKLNDFAAAMHCTSSVAVPNARLFVRGARDRDGGDAQPFSKCSAMFRRCVKCEGAWV